MFRIASKISVVISVALFFMTGAPAVSADATAACALTNPHVKVSLLHGPNRIDAGGDLSIAGIIENGNPYAISAIDVVLRVVKLAKRAGSTYDTATDTVDRLTPMSLYLNASSSTSFYVTWHAPASLLTGPYRIDVYLDSAGQFAVGGTEYLGIPAASYAVLVNGKTNQTSFIDQSSLRVNGTAPSPMGLVGMAGNDSIKATLHVESTYTAPRTASVIWTLYHSNFADPESVVATGTSQIIIAPNGEVPATFSAKGITHSDYILAAELIDGYKHSYISTRLVRTDIVEPSFRSLYVSAFPLSPDHDLLVGCLAENFAPNDMSTSTVQATLTGSNGETIYSGSLIKVAHTPLYYFQLAFTPKGSLNQDMTLSGRVFDGAGRLLASSSVAYACDPDGCAAEAARQGRGVTWSSGMLSAEIATALAAVIALVVWIFHRRRQGPSQNI
ncbi:MAG: hypothetical protein KGI79_00725 [Patescibacteria group bacterium]|nr:hypothetical protein [Patescibacteria group bacterium]MDE2116386.1 hypothetical protein [Patescibacteria group bacterium]